MANAVDFFIAMQTFHALYYFGLAGDNFYDILSANRQAYSRDIINKQSRIYQNKIFHISSSTLTQIK